MRVHIIPAEQFDHICDGFGESFKKAKEKLGV
jgi:hypothetical protein